MLYVTKKLFGKTTLGPYVSSWSIVREGICSRRSPLVKKTTNWWPSEKSGIFLSKPFEVYTSSIKRIFYTEISSRPIFFSILTVKLKLETWMCPKSLRKAFFILKRELRIMRVPKFGRINRIIKKAIFGLSDALFMKWRLWNLLLEPRTWKGCIKE